MTALASDLGELRGSTGAEALQLGALHTQAEAMLQHGALKDSVQQLLNQAMVRQPPTDTSIETPRDLFAVLTPAQRAWLLAHRRGGGDKRP
jgi:hypothetical protein